MNVQDLFETPRLEPKELPIYLGPHRPFNSMATLSVKYDILSTNPYYVGISKDKSFAFIGKYGIRDDDVDGAFVLGIIDFKKSLNISSTIDVTLPKNILQVDEVEIEQNISEMALATICI